jgi:hypothetical protein
MFEGRVARVGGCSQRADDELALVRVVLIGLSSEEGERVETAPPLPGFQVRSTLAQSTHLGS